jgi:hypothetical protein
VLVFSGSGEIPLQQASASWKTEGVRGQELLAAIHSATGRPPHFITSIVTG